MLRSEYSAIQRLMWDADLRRRFVADPRGHAHAELSSVLAESIGAREVAGIEESAYYRIASCARALVVIFENGSVLLNAFGGLRYLEVLLKTYLEAPTPRHSTHELFDGYILGPEAIRVARGFLFESHADWLVHVLEYEWALWHSRRCALGWAPLVPPLRGFKRTAFFLRVPFELQALLDDVVRMRAAHVPEAVYRWRCVPNFGHPTYLLVFTTADNVATLELNADAQLNLQRYTQGTEPLAPSLAAVLEPHGLV